MINRICFENVTKSFRKRTVLKGIDFEIVPGRIYGLIGVNGSGKSTLMKVMVGLMEPDMGNVRIEGEEAPGDIGFMIEDPTFIPNLSGRENLRILAGLYDGFDMDNTDWALKGVRLSSRANDPYRTYSWGMKQSMCGLVFVEC